eukprot:14346-Alexandrium_andersonii.AAC.1
MRTFDLTEPACRREVKGNKCQVCTGCLSRLEKHSGHEWRARKAGNRRSLAAAARHNLTYARAALAAGRWPPAGPRF